MTPEGGAFMRIIDAQPGSPTFGQELSRYRTRREVGIHNMEIVGTRAYVAYYQDGVRIIELADPANPVEVAHYNTFDDAIATGAAFEGAVRLPPGGELVLRRRLQPRPDHLARDPVIHGPRRHHLQRQYFIQRSSSRRLGRLPYIRMPTR